MIFIRRAEPADAAQIQRVYASTNAFSNTLQLPHPTVEMWQQRLTQLNPDDTFLIAVYDGVVVGTAGLHVEKKLRRRHVASLGMAVADSFTGRGVGTALLAELLSLADNWLNVLRIELIVYSDNAAAVHLYNKFGFEIEGTMHAHSLRNGVFVDAYSMARFHPKQPQIPRTGR
ncbi:GNAT family N-acetyltransferase [Undibacterium sp. Jales W-56]|uniref:GNAT family N-acetyltransferase n=1 Tax=Undibacterium sp. Jales W-56 TaxID=2897325 RepID=UPI0021CFE0A5|nr:GNAT family N-acetyltransferase [Undibacterium sp. Jales W-56]MCU6435597.1 GNAT family N-acetyltransferase [Undibacterium sp. Jales W-56]